MGLSNIWNNLKSDPAIYMILMVLEFLIIPTRGEYYEIYYRPF